LESAEAQTAPDPSTRPRADLSALSCCTDLKSPVRARSGRPRGPIDCSEADFIPACVDGDSRGIHTAAEVCIDVANRGDLPWLRRSPCATISTVRV
jgi:hypothetical protein